MEREGWRERGRERPVVTPPESHATLISNTIATP
jgi:hypothetical protein